MERAANLSNSFLKLSRWAEGYERRQGQPLCSGNHDLAGLGMSPAGLARQFSINGAQRLGVKTEPPESCKVQWVAECAKPRFQRRFHKPIPRRRACSSS